MGSKGVAYLNVDCAVQGPGFFARATPQLDTILVEVTKKVKQCKIALLVYFRSNMFATRSLASGKGCVKEDKGVFIAFDDRVITKYLLQQRLSFLYGTYSIEMCTSDINYSGFFLGDKSRLSLWKYRIM